MIGVFAEWQPIYAQHGIATFPCTANKTPAVRNYASFGVAASTAIAARFANANAFGFMCGKRSAVTVLDVDSKDERILGEALNQYGKTPIIVRSGSGNFQAWYRHRGERRHIRPSRALPIDVLGGGYVVAPPSRVEAGHYEFIEGSLDNLGNLPTLQRLPLAELPSEWANKREGDGRNSALFTLVGRAAHSADDFDQLLDYARTQNEQFGKPLPDAEVLKVAKSVWRMQSEGRNRFGKFGAYVPLELVRKLAKWNPDALALLNVLKAENGPDSTFPIANGMANNALGMGRLRLVQARNALIELGLVDQVSPPTQHNPAFFRWPKPIQGAESEQ